MTWNIEGWGRNCHNLKHFTNNLRPDFIFLSEPQCFQCDISEQFSIFNDSFSYHLNSEDLLNPDLPLDTRKAIGGTMALWRTKFDPYVRVLPSTSSSHLPLLLSIPGIAISAHIAIYLPTSGKEAEFIAALAALDKTVIDIREEFSCPIYIRGDCNVNPNNKSRAALFKHFCEKHSLSSLDLQHPTHHHFLGDGLFDVQLDALLYVGPPGLSDQVEKIICKMENPLVQSHHDIVLSSILLSRSEVALPERVEAAPRVPNNRVKIFWDESNIPLYQSLLSDTLTSLRNRWADATSPSCFSLLLSATNDALMSAATASNRHIKLGSARKPKPANFPEIEAAQSASLLASSCLQNIKANPAATPDAVVSARSLLASAKASLQREIRSARYNACYTRDSKLFTILDKNPSELFKSIKSLNLLPPVRSKS